MSLSMGDTQEITVILGQLITTQKGTNGTFTQVHGLQHPMPGDSLSNGLFGFLFSPLWPASRKAGSRCAF